MVNTYTEDEMQEIWDSRAITLTSEPNDYTIVSIFSMGCHDFYSLSRKEFIAKELDILVKTEGIVFKKRGMK